MNRVRTWMLWLVIGLLTGCGPDSTKNETYKTARDIEALHQERAPGKIYAFESAKIIMKLPKHGGIRVLYIDNWGNTIVQIDSSQTMKGVAYRYTYKDGQSTYWQDTPQGELKVIKRTNETPDDVRFTTATDDKLEGLSKEELQESGFTQLADEDIAGYPCKVFYNEMLKLKVWQWNDINLKSESLLIKNDPVVNEVFYLDTAISIPSELLEVPGTE